MNLDKTFDYHVHIGQFYEDYFEPHKVIETLSANGSKGCWFSSTTSCMSWSNGTEKTYLRNHIRDEVKEALETAKKSNFDAKAFYWVNLDEYLQEIDKKECTLQDYFISSINEVEYYGIKIHTRFNYWDINNENVIEIFNLVCEYAKDHNMPILIHCGPDECDRPDRFEKWFEEYNEVRFILAHMRPVDTTIKMMKKYNNVWTDTAFAPDESVEKVFSEGLGDRVLYGTDYPLNKEVYLTDLNNG